ncbi:MAG: phosphoribosylanthranilate isomerase [Paraperlucidibaca sp.]
MSLPARARTRVKICGITRSEDALHAIAAGADALGFVFYEPSPRAVSAEQAAAIIATLPPLVTCVGLFVDAPAQLVRDTLAMVPLSLLQFHGDEPEAYCQQFQQPYMKALRVQAGDDVAARMREYPSASAILLDAWHPTQPGGTGLSFDWQQVPNELSNRVVLAGGLSASNVADAIRATSPYAVDVSGGVESAKGIKSAEKLVAFMAGVQSA